MYFVFQVAMWAPLPQRQASVTEDHALKVVTAQHKQKIQYFAQIQHSGILRWVKAHLIAMHVYRGCIAVLRVCHSRQAHVKLDFIVSVETTLQILQVL